MNALKFLVQYLKNRFMLLTKEKTRELDKIYIFQKDH